MENLGIHSSHESKNDESINPVRDAIQMYKNHPSILKIKSKCTTTSFSVTEFTEKDILDEINKLNAKKGAPHGDIPAKRLKECSDICSGALCAIVNDCITQSKFPTELKLADITPIHKGEDRTAVKNYRPVSVLPTVSKVFERLLH